MYIYIIHIVISSPFIPQSSHLTCRKSRNGRRTTNASPRSLGLPAPDVAGAPRRRDGRPVRVVIGWNNLQGGKQIPPKWGGAI